ncbi:glycine zipper domain-containing protein [Gordonia araii]|uniref:glycine zipper domain-containing protein n=1 Tax=Gordonia araii TaxID=263909 RepID=UPI0011100370|nr:glycine zipper domain-containing protein [Gordonia araii]NNG99209.1 hypothetical protein [Gordonia araii NBRC 100433]
MPAENDPDQAADDALALLKGTGPHTDPDIADRQARAALRGQGLIVDTRINPATGRQETIITDPVTGYTRHITTNPDGTPNITEIPGIQPDGTTAPPPKPFLTDPRWGPRGDILQYGGVAGDGAGAAMKEGSKKYFEYGYDREGRFLKRMSKIMKKGGTAGAIGSGLIDWHTGERTLGDAAKATSAGMAGAFIGGAIGSLVPGFGTVIGAGIGAAVGSALGTMAYDRFK